MSAALIPLSVLLVTSGQICQQLWSLCLCFWWLLVKYCINLHVDTQYPRVWGAWDKIFIIGNSSPQTQQPWTHTKKVLFSIDLLENDHKLKNLPICFLYKCELNSSSREKFKKCYFFKWLVQDYFSLNILSHFSQG